MSVPFGIDAGQRDIIDAGQGGDIDAWQRAVILRNVEKDPHYAPYCMRCTGLVRMARIARHYWRCRCGAPCDYRDSRGGAL